MGGIARPEALHLSGARCRESYAPQVPGVKRLRAIDEPRGA
jgi:hypothetical protein